MTNAQAVSVTQLNLKGFSAAQTEALLTAKGLKLELVDENNQINLQNQELLERQLIAAQLDPTIAKETAQNIIITQTRKRNAEAIHTENEQLEQQNAQLAINALEQQNVGSKLGSFFKFLKSPSGILMAISAAISIYQILKNTFGLFKSAKERLEETKKKVEEVTQAWTQQQNVVKDITNKINEYSAELTNLKNKQGNLTLNEKQRLSYLQSQTTELKAQLKAEETLQKIRQQEAEKEYKKSVKSTTEGMQKGLTAAGWTSRLDYFSKYFSDNGSLFDYDTISEAIGRLYGTTDTQRIKELEYNLFSYVTAFSEDTNLLPEELLDFGKNLRDYYQNLQILNKEEANWTDRLDTLNDVYKNTLDPEVKEMAKQSIEDIYYNIYSKSLYGSFDKWLEFIAPSEDEKKKLAEALIGLEGTEASKYIEENIDFAKAAAGGKWQEYIQYIINNAEELFSEYNSEIELTAEELKTHFENVSKASEALKTVQNSFTSLGNVTSRELGNLKEALNLTDGEIQDLYNTIKRGNEEEVTQKLKKLAAQYITNEYNLSKLNKATKDKIATDLKYLGIQANMENFLKRLNELEVKRSKILMELNTLIMANRVSDLQRIEDLKEAYESLGKQISDLYVDISFDTVEQLDPDYEKAKKQLELDYELGKISTKDYLEQLTNLYNQYIKGRKEYVSEDESIQKEIFKTQKKVMDEQKEQLEQARDYVDYILDQRIAALDKEKDALEEKSDEEERALNLEKAKQKLQNAQQRNMRVWYEDVGWVWEADPAAVQEAEQEVKDAQKDIALANIEEQKQVFEEAKNQLSELTSWTEVLQNKLSAENLFGANFVSEI